MMQFNTAPENNSVEMGSPNVSHLLPVVEPSVQVQKSSRKIKLPMKLFLFLVVVALLVMQGVLVFFAFNPPYLYQYNVNKQVLDELSALTTINPYDNPVFTVVTDANALREENQIQAQVYKDAQDGDHVIGFSDKIIVYRRKEKRIVYEGPGPQALVDQTNKAIADEVVKAVKDAGLVSSENAEIPDMRVVTDAVALKKQDAVFYADAKEGDIIATYSEGKLIVVYRPDSDSIVAQGNYDTVISTL